MSDTYNYYELLGISPLANSKQIRSAFRKRAKKLHPDILSFYGRRNSDNRRMHRLIKAYRTLSDAEMRQWYDRTHGIYAPEKGEFNFRGFLKRQRDYKSMARLIFYDLLHSRNSEALHIYEHYFSDELQNSMTRSSRREHLSFYFSYNDYMDCLYLLAEAYEKRRAYYTAMSFYRVIAALESYQKAFGHFFEETKEAIFRIIEFWEKKGYSEYITHFIPMLVDIVTLKEERTLLIDILTRHSDPEPSSEAEITPVENTYSKPAHTTKDNEQSRMTETMQGVKI